MYAVIMAGGTGTRLWPLSRKTNPKQFHPLITDEPMLRETFLRLKKIFKPEKILISTIPSFEETSRKILPEIPEENFIVEPELIGNAAACGLVSTIISKKDHNANAIFLPADAHIKNKEKFLEVISYAEQLLQKHSDHIVAIGINPTRPDTGYGYIQIDNQIESNKGLKAFGIKRFVEKPDLDTAQKYLDSFEYLWNSGIFAWNIKTILGLYKDNLPKTFRTMEKIKASLGTVRENEVIKNEYTKSDRTTIDYGIMEKTNKLLVIPGDFGWSDVGTWESVLNVIKEIKGIGIISKGNHLSIEDKDCIVMADKKLIATIGLKNIAVIDTPDALLVCNTKQSQKVKELLQKLEEEGKHLYL